MTGKQKRTTLAKAKRIAAGEASRKLAKEPTSRESHIKARKAGDMILFETRTGYFSPRSGPMFGVHELEVVEAHDTPTALVEVCMKAGVAVLGSLFRVNVQNMKGEEAMKALAAAAAQWMKLDVEALRKELEEERADQAETPAPVTEPAPEVNDGTV
jgi:hypothetical protein